jgi:Uma2 family endonuclease
MAAKPPGDFSLEAYLSLEQESGIKYEYHDGTVVAMAGGTIEHGLISGNIFGDLWKITRTTGLDKTLAIEALNLEIPLSAVYEGVVWG